MTDGSKGPILAKLIALIANLLFFALLLRGCGQKEPVEKAPIPIVNVFQVKNISKIVTPNYPGKAAATQEADLSFRVSGALIQFPVNVGDEVREGDLMACIDPRDFENTLTMAQAQLAVDTASLRLAEMEYCRLQKIRQREAQKVSGTLINQKWKVYTQRKIEVESLIASVTAVQNSLSYTKLQAPFDGTVAETFVNNYEYVQAQEPVIHLIDISAIKFSVEIPEDYVSIVSQADKAVIQFKAYPNQEILASIKEVGKVSSNTVRTCPIILIIKQRTEYKICPGMSGYCHFEFYLSNKSANRPLEIPFEALFNDSKGQHGIWIIDKESHTVSFRKVKLGILTQKGITVLEGLQPDDWIVASIGYDLHEGDLVRLMISKKSISK